MLVTGASEVTSAGDLGIYKFIDLLPASETNIWQAVVIGSFNTVLLTSATELSTANDLQLTKYTELVGATELDIGNSFYKQPFKKYYGEFNVYFKPDYKINLINIS